MEVTKILCLIILGTYAILGNVKVSGIKNELYGCILRLISLGLIIYICSN